MAHLPSARLLFTAARTINNKQIMLQSSVRNLISKQLEYSEFGDPIKVVKYKETTVPALESHDVLVRMLAAPINPADINTIQGKYPVKVQLPSVPGNEGVGIVEDIGKDVKDITKGNKVIITKPVQGTWRNIAVFKKEVLKVVPDELGIVEAATISVNPCTAYRMLSDFKPVKNGLVVIQNGANSACGQNVIQICQAWGVKTVNIVRDRPEINELKKYLQDLGATYVLTEEELRSTNIFKEKKIDKPSLALNCVGGKSSSAMLRHLQPAGKMVTYGGMSREPVTIPTSAFIFKNISFHGFWMTAWNEKASQADKDKMLSDIIALMCENKLKAPVSKMVKFEKYEDALGNALTMQGFTGCNCPCRPTLPCIPGKEGVGEVVEVGSVVTKVEPGQRVIIKSGNTGTWRLYGVYNQSDVHVVPSNIDLASASMLAVGACTAYRMIKDFWPRDHPLSEKVIVQNGANSPCGQCVIQLGQAWGIKTYNVVTSHCGYEALKTHLDDLGATHVLTLDEAEEMCQQCTNCNRSISKAILGLNCLQGRYEDVVINFLAKKGVVVQYGKAYDDPQDTSQRSDISYHKFDLTEWTNRASSIEKEKMYNEVTRLMVIGKFKAPLHKIVDLNNFRSALYGTSHNEAFSTGSYIFEFTS